MRVAIDGPIAVGKGTVARKTAEQTEMTYVDTGVLFRAVGIYCLSSRVPINNETAVCRHLAVSPPDIELRTPMGSEQDGRLNTVTLDKRDVSWEIRSSGADKSSSVVARYECVRDFILIIERELARHVDVVMEGRDIGTFVFPDAEVKVFLTASEDIRAQRRYKELRSRGIKTSYEQVRRDLHTRDHDDMTRPLRPLKKADDAVEIDTSAMTIEEVVTRVVGLVEAHGHE